MEQPSDLDDGLPLPARPRAGRWWPTLIAVPLLAVLLAVNPFPDIAEAPMVPAEFTPVAEAEVVPTVLPSPTSLPAATPLVPTPLVPTPTAARPAGTTPAPTASLPTPTVVPSPTPVPVPGLPQRIIIPRIGIRADIEEVGLTPDNAMDVPKGFDTVGWYNLGARPGQLGSAVMTGHVDSTTGPAIFWRLREVRPGDEVIVVGEDGVERRFVVRETESYPYDEAPIERIFAATEQVSLNLITCTGTFDRRSQNYNQRLVVYTTLAAPVAASEPAPAAPKP